MLSVFDVDAEQANAPDYPPHNGELLVTLSVQHGSLALDPLAVGGVVVTDPDGSNGDLSFYGLQVGITAALDGLVYTPELDYNNNIGNELGNVLESLTITVDDQGNTGDEPNPPGTLTTTRVVPISVVPVNDVPAFTKGDDQTVNEDAGLQTVEPWATGITPGSGADESSQTLTFNVTFTVTDTLTFTSPPAIDAAGKLTYETAPDTNGTATVSVTLSDDGGAASGGVDTSAAQTFTITVNALNDAPVFTVAAANQMVDEDAGLQTVANWATGIAPGPLTATDESGQTLTFNVTVTGTTGTLAFKSAPAIDATTGTLTYEPAEDTNGTATVSVTLSDDGGVVVNGDVDTSAPQTFTITVNSINDPPVIDGAQISHVINDTESVVTFNSVTIWERDPGQNVSVTITLHDETTGPTVPPTGANGGFTTDSLKDALGVGFDDQGNGTYTLAPTTTAEATTHIRRLVFQPTENQVNPGNSVTTRFVITADDGQAVNNTFSNGGTVLEAMSVNDRPTISGTMAGLTVGDKSTIFPFADRDGDPLTVDDYVLIADADANQTLTVTVGLDNAAKGSFTDASLTASGFDGPKGGPYTFTGIAAAATAAIVQLEFDPTEHLAPTAGETTTWFNITVDDGRALPTNNSGTSVIVTSENDPPQGTPDFYSIYEGGTLNAMDTIGSNPIVADGVLANDRDPDRDSMTAELVSGPAHHVGTFTLNGNGSFVYQHDGLDETVDPYTDTFTYRLKDAHTLLADQPIITATITIVGVNDPPQPVDDPAIPPTPETTTDEKTPKDIDAAVLLQNDTDPDPGQTSSLVVVSVANSAGGALVSLNGTTITYDPNGKFDWLGDGESTTDTFVYTVKDIEGATATATVTVTITGVNDAPTAVDDAFATDEDASTVTGNVLVANSTTPDSDPESDALTVIAVEGSTGNVNTEFALDSGALLTLNDIGTFTYKPAGAFDQLAVGDQGQDSFEYTIDDGHGGTATATATVTITITGVNDAPAVADVSMDATENGLPQTESFAGDDVDRDDNAGTLTYTILSNPSEGSVKNNDNGSFTFSPGGAFQDLAQGQTRLVNFTYQATDSHAEPSASAATVTVTVTGVNDAPTVAAVSMAATEDGPAVQRSFVGNDVDSDDNTTSLTYTILSNPAAGSVQNNNNGTFTFNPGSGFQDLAAGAKRTVSFTYRATDSHGVPSAFAGTVSVTVTGVNDAPTAGAVSVAATEDGPAVTRSFAGNDVDSDDDTGTLAYAITILSGPAEGSAQNNGDGTFTFDPGSDFQDLSAGETRAVSFTYGAMDSHNVTSVLAGTVTVTVTGTNDAPTVSDLSMSAVEDGPTVTRWFAGDDIDSEDEPALLTYSILSDPLEGSVRNNGNGTFTFDPGSDFQDLATGETRTVSFTYGATDSHNVPSAAGATVTVTVTGVNDAPTAANVSANAKSGSAAVVDSFAGDDVDSDDDTGTLTYTIVSNPSEGSVSNNNDGTFTFDPGSDFQDLVGSQTRAVSFAYNAMDSHDVTSVTSGTVTVTVAGPDLPPAIDPTQVFTFEIPENSANGLAVTTVQADDPDTAAGDLSFSITGANPGDAFSIDNSGVIRVANSSALDFETNPTFTLDVHVTDDSSPALSDTATFTVNLTDVTEPFVIDSGDWTNGGLTIVRNDPWLHVRITGTSTDAVPARLFAKITDLVITGRNGVSDTLTIDFAGGSPIPTGGIAYEGGSGAGIDTLVLQDTGATPIGTVNHQFTSASSGNVSVDGNAITYTGLEPVIDNLVATDRTFTFGESDDIVTLSGTAAISEISSVSSSETVTFANPTGTLTVDTAGGNDVIDVSAMVIDVSLIGGAGTDRLVAQADADMTLSMIVDGSRLTIDGIAAHSASGIEHVHLTGGVSSNTLDASAFLGTVQLNGGAGNDILHGGQGDDSLFGEDGNDTIEGNQGSDTILGGDGADSLLGGSGGDLLDGGAGDDRLFGQGSSHDTLIGGPGNDHLNGDNELGGNTGSSDFAAATADGDMTVQDGQLTAAGLGTDILVNIDRVRLTGGDGDNTLDATAFSGIAYLIGGPGQDMLLGGAGNDRLYGQLGDDSMVGGAGRDFLYGGGGKDYLDGGLGDDAANGQSDSDDTIVASVGNDTLRGGSGNDTLLVTGDGTFTLGQKSLTGPGIEAIVKTMENAVITGGAGNDTINARDFLGQVSLNGGGGNDVLIGGVRGDELNGGDGNDTLVGGDGADNLNGGDGADVLAGYAGEDKMSGGDGNDTLVGGTDNDSLSGGIGDDLLAGEEGNDTLRGDDGFDTLSGGPGVDSIESDTNDTIDDVFVDLTALLGALP